MLTALTIFACLAFAARTLYVARFGLRSVIEQPFNYRKMKRSLTTASVSGVALAVIVAMVRGDFLLPLTCLAASVLISHFVKFGTYRRAATQLSDSRMNDGSYVLRGDPTERDQAAVAILDIEMKAGTRQ